jgi:hypothetical protein
MLAQQQSDRVRCADPQAEAGSLAATTSTQP